MCNDPPPLISELFKLLPNPGENFSAYDRKTFLKATIAAFDVVYQKSPTQIHVVIQRWPQ